MLKAVIFDDEYIVLQGLQRMIDWSQHGIEIVGTASNGQAAWTLFETRRPDIVFTDIRMPGMDGLQLIEKILMIAPETVCVIFSGFNEFEYVRQAIKLGVVDYLEKPITVPMIEHTLQKTFERINQQKIISTLKSKWEMSQRELLGKVTLDLLLLGAEAEAKWRECFGADAAKVVGVTVLAFSVSGYSLNEHPSYRAIPIRNGSEHLLVVFHFDIQADALWEQLLLWSEHIEVTVGSGQTYSLVIDAPKSYREALQALKYGQFVEGKGWTHFEDVGEEVNLKFLGSLSEQQEAIIFYMRTGNKAELFQQLNSFIKCLESERIHPDIVESEILKLVYLGMEVAKETGGDVYKVWQPEYLPHVEMRGMNTREEVFGWLHSQMEMIIDWTIAVRKKTKHAAVESACSYMENHFTRNLTLQEMSEYVGMNTTYFSLLFKEEIGQSYVKYLTQLRMERAKELLRKGEKVTDVSEKVGYHSYSHFSELFKKHVGMKPGQYKDSFLGIIYDSAK